MAIVFSQRQQAAIAWSLTLLAAAAAISVLAFDESAEMLVGTVE